LEFRFLEEMRKMAMSSKIVTNCKPDIIDINFVCKKVVCKGAGAGV
jgi:tRNA-dihydrouridine synthase